MHANKSIRDALTAAVTGLTTTGTNVGDSVWSEPDLPSLRVLFSAEAIPDESQEPESYYRAAEYLIEIRVQGEDYQDQLDQIRSEVETAVQANDTLGLTGVKVQLAGTGPLATDPEDSRGIAFLPISYVVTYRTTVDDPDTLIA